MSPAHQQPLRASIDLLRPEAAQHLAAKEGDRRLSKTNSTNGTATAKVTIAGCGIDPAAWAYMLRLMRDWHLIVAICLSLAATGYLLVRIM